jgi:hypothetical protein
MEGFFLGENTFSHLKKIYANELRKLVTATIVVHSAVPVKTVFFEFSHSPGEERTTGTPTTKANDSRINKLVEICTAVIMFKGSVCSNFYSMYRYIEL